MSKLTIAGIGPGKDSYVLPVVTEAMNRADIVIAAKRLIPMLEKMCPDGIFVPMGSIAETLDRINAELKSGREIVLTVSGDPLMYSMYRTICNDPRSEEWEIRILPGIGSLQMLGAAIDVTMEDALILSVHGRELAPGKIALAVTEHVATFFLCSKEKGPAWLADIMMEYGLMHVTVHAGSDLSYDKERIISGSPEQIMQIEFPSLCVAAITNPAPHEVMRPAFLTDREFERDRTPMTKEEIRVLILHRMAIAKDEIIWDIGAGTGSVSIECARQAPFGDVYSVERDPAALELIARNREKFSVDNLHICEGNAHEWLTRLPCPDKVFIGGSGGEFEEIIRVISAFQQNIKVVVSAVTIETIAQAGEVLGRYDPDYEVIQATIGRGRKIGGYHIMDTNNPVMIFSAVV